jgi:hypothetical protein
MSTAPPLAPDAEGTAIEAVIESLAAAFPEDPLRAGPGRPPVISSLIVWTSVLLAVLRGFSSQRDIWRIATSRRIGGHDAVACSDQTIYNRLAEGEPAMQRLFGQVSTLLTARLAQSEVIGCHDLVPFATKVVALDETTLDPVRRTLTALREAPTDALVPGKLALLFDLRTQQWLHLETTRHPHQNEKVLARQMLATLPRRSLIVADLGYFSFPWFDDLTRAGMYWISRVRDKTSYDIEHTYYQDGTTFDGLVWLGGYRADKAAHLVRLIEFEVDGHLRRFLTNLRHPRRLSAHDVARVYARRWDIEMAIQLLKEHLQLRVLWSAKPEVVWVQVWAVLIVSQILQTLRLEIADRAGVDPFEVSMPLLVQYVPYLMAQGAHPLDVFVRDGRRLGLIRPSRRTVVKGPTIDPALIVPYAIELARWRPPRYAGK